MKPTLTPHTSLAAFGAAVEPERRPEDDSPTDQVGQSALFAGIMSALGVPPSIAHMLEAAHHGSEALKSDPASLPSRGEENIDPTAFTPGRSFKPSGR